MEMARFKISEEEYKELYRIEKATKDKKISQRLKVVMMRYEGKKVREIAVLLCQYFAQTKMSKTRTKRGTGWTGGAV